MSGLRSLLFAPGNHARRMEKALASGADAVIFDLEDAVAHDEKTRARTAVAAHLTHVRGERKAYVRVNALSTPWSYDDFGAVVVAGLDGVLLPKAESAADIAIADYLIAALERSRGLPSGAIDLLPIVETAKGIVNVTAIATAAPRVKRLCFGSGDFSNDTNTPWTRDNVLLRQSRAQLAIASRAAGLAAPLDTVWPLLDDDTGLIAEAREARAMGYGGKMTIHPKQLAAVNRAFAPSPDEIARARAICAAFDAAEASGSAAIVVDGTFVDYPVVYRARQVLAAVRPGSKRAE